MPKKVAALGMILLLLLAEAALYALGDHLAGWVRGVVATAVLVAGAAVAVGLMASSAVRRS